MCNKALHHTKKNEVGEYSPEFYDSAYSKFVERLETDCIPFSEELLRGDNDEKYLKMLNDVHLNLKTGQSQIW